MSQTQNIHTPEEIARIRVAAAVTAQVRDQLAAAVRPGMTTFDLDCLAGEFIRATGGVSAFLGYYGYPANVCISVNDVVIHGIGSPEVVIAEHDLVSIDVGVKLNSAVGDTAVTVAVGGVTDPAVKRLMDGTQEALQAGIRAALPGCRVGDISRAIEQVAKKHHLGIVRDYVGHGCGTKMHEPPEVPNYTGWGRGSHLQQGHTLKPSMLR